MSPFTGRYLHLLRTVRRLRKKFITPYVPANPMVGPDVYELDVKAYCVLSHAAIEEYLEETALSLLSESIDGWNLRQKMNRTLIALVAYYGAKSDLEEDRHLDTTKCFDRIRKLLQTLKQRYSTEINQNHGIAIKFLRRILYPVAVDITSDPNQVDALEKLAAERGSYAHKHRIRQVLSPEDAAKHVTAVITMCRDATRHAMTLAAQAR